MKLSRGSRYNFCNISFVTLLIFAFVLQIYCQMSFYMHAYQLEEVRDSCQKKDFYLMELKHKYTSLTNPLSVYAHAKVDLQMKEPMIGDVRTTF